jgi:hypothetical protein
MPVTDTWLFRLPVVETAEEAVDGLDSRTTMEEAADMELDGRAHVCKGRKLQQAQGFGHRVWRVIGGIFVCFVLEDGDTLLEERYGVVVRRGGDACFSDSWTRVDLLGFHADSH